MADDGTTRSEMEGLGIEPEHFDRLYGQLNQDLQLPPGDIVPWNQYTKIVNYLRDKQVLGEGNKIQPDGVRVFDSRRELETKLDRPEDYDPDYGEIPAPRGGLLSCRSRSPGRSGGIAPCRS